MYRQSNVTSTPTITQPRSGAWPGDQARAFLLCLLGVLGFSFSLPATRIASGQIDPWILGPGRGALAALFALALLVATRSALPSAAQLRQLAVVSGGVVIGFPLLTSLALERVPTYHVVVLVGLTPLVTSALATLRNGERPSLAFWLFALLGAGSVALFGISAHGLRVVPADVLVLAAVLAVSLGYSEGGRLAASLGGIRVICWALVLSLPFSAGSIVYALSYHPLPVPSVPALLGFGYLSLVSALLAFCAWYQGLALGGVSRGSQVQLLQPVLSLLWCALLLHEPLGRDTLLAGAAVLASAAGSRWTRA